MRRTALCVFGDFTVKSKPEPSPLEDMLQPLSCSFFIMHLKTHEQVALCRRGPCKVKCHRRFPLRNILVIC